MESESDSILISTKKMAGIDKSYEVFDLDIITYINAVFMILNQLGVGTKSVFSINDSTATWSEFEEGNSDIKACRAYMAQKVRLKFDPPTSATIKQALQESIDELEWRLVHQVEINRHLGEA
uniref:Uncharacterized protein n=1 Tax=Siphoviridae sp. ctuyW65 TaxID=2826508 RepID=A0A8S5QVS3_9CAUD|nr:MAG TPA: hypothetical protein [Siphoviridae sp. ctuyW65]